MNQYSINLKKLERELNAKLYQDLAAIFHRAANEAFTDSAKIHFQNTSAEFSFVARRFMGAV